MTVRFNNNTNTLSSDTALKSQGSRGAHKGEQLRSHQRRKEHPLPPGAELGSKPRSAKSQPGAVTTPF